MGPGGVTVTLLDYGSGNLRSAFRALEAAGARVTLTSDPGLARSTAGLVVPGVGAYAACMAGLRAVGGDEVIRDRLARELPVLGICVGHQVMFGHGLEHGEDTPGVGILPGTVERLEATRLPHMGWNTVQPAPDSTVFDSSQEWFYFVHSYGVHPTAELAGTPGVRLTRAVHEDDTFVAAVEYGALTTTQFHPEKSGRAGARFLRAWVDGLSRG